MFETAEIGSKLDKREFAELVPKLRTDLLRLQYELREADFPVVVVIEGDDRVGVRQALNRLPEWMDLRFLYVEAFRAETEEERDHPLFWRYWRALPSRGRIGIFLNAWTLYALLEQVRRKKPDELLLERRVRHIRSFEQALVDDGALLLKFWLHIPKSKLSKRIKTADEDPETAWQVSDEDRNVYRSYGRVIPFVERLLRLTSTGEAAWQVVESSDARFRDASIGKAIRSALSERLERRSPRTGTAPRAVDAAQVKEEVKTILDTVDLTASISREKYEKHLLRWQGEVARLTRRACDAGLSTVLVFQGWDAAGKGGAIRRLTQAIDASICRVIPISAPSDEERARHYLWRFWRRLPAAGCIRIFDRSWYERVLVERVEAFASGEEWRRAYGEIHDFEEQLCEHGMLVLKFWLHIDSDEQLRRFQEREQTPFKKHKITEEDYRNRARWRDYELAVNEMVARTHTPAAPWHLVPANDKRYARIEVLRTVAKGIEKAL